MEKTLTPPKTASEKDALPVTDPAQEITERSNRHVGALADYVIKDLREKGERPLGVEGQIGNDWVLIDMGDVIVHIFRPEVRAFYNLEKIWSVPLPEAVQQFADTASIAD